MNNAGSRRVSASSGPKYRLFEPRSENRCRPRAQIVESRSHLVIANNARRISNEKMGEDLLLK
jgi:hypothetical protein